MIETMVRCPFCGQDNPAQYRFCGMCGKAITPSADADAKGKASLREVPVASPPSRGAGEGRREEITRQDASRNEEIPFTGPSFLGLSSGPSSDHAEYLLDDEASSSGHGRMYLALILLVIAAGLLGWRWYYGGFPWQQRSSAPAVTTTAQTNGSGNTTSAPNSQTPAPQAAPSTTPSAVTPGQANTQNPPATNPATASAASADKAAANTSTDAASSETSSSSASAVAPPATAGNADTGASQASQEQQPDQTTPAVEAKKTAPAKRTSARAAKRAVDRAALSDEDSSASEGEALLTQGERYLYGTGVPQNCGRAQSSLEAAADHGSSRALSDLGSMYSTGHCVRRDLPTAYRWFVKALHQQPANNRISTDLQVLWNQMTPEEKQAAMKER